MHSNAFEQVFTNTLNLASELKVNSYRREFLNEGLHQLDWYPAFLKIKKAHPDLIEVAQYEAIKHFVSLSDLGAPVKELDILKINPNLQMVFFTHAHPIISKNKGLYLILKVKNRMIEILASPIMAMTLDLLKEDRKFSFEQILDDEWRGGFDKIDWLQNLNFLIENQIIICKRKIA